VGHAFLQLITERVATTLELLPERVDLLSFVVEIAVAFTILGTAMLLLGGRTAGQPVIVRRPQRFAILGAVIAISVFSSVYAIPEGRMNICWISIATTACPSGSRGWQL
jgi:putative Mn2+ efflux pump MntP